MGGAWIPYKRLGEGGGLAHPGLNWSCETLGLCTPLREGTASLGSEVSELR